uniref:Ig-like domain-containing protein n=1 Tax=Oreochromis aureus TaxID=47969 RepID=A0A668RGA7_OREAU
TSTVFDVDGGSVCGTTGLWANLPCAVCWSSANHREESSYNTQRAEVKTSVHYQKNITAESEQNVTLTCRAPNINVGVVKWSRRDQNGQYVLLYRDEQFVPDFQHPSFKNRVDLQDRQMKDGNVSLILKNVTINDTGTYECQVIPRGGNDLTPISIIYLHVAPPGE